MNGQNDMPKWTGHAIKIAGFLVIGTLAWANLNAQVDAVDKVADANTATLTEVKDVDAKQAEQITEIRMNQAVVTNILKNLDKSQTQMGKVLEEIQKDLKLHRTSDPD